MTDTVKETNIIYEQAAQCTILPVMKNCSTKLAFSSQTAVQHFRKDKVNVFK